MASVKFPFNLAVTTSSLRNGAVGVPYSATLSARGGNGPHTWQLVSGSALPAGLVLTSGSGVISGKPKHSGTTRFTVEVVDTKTTAVPAHPGHRLEGPLDLCLNPYPTGWFAAPARPGGGGR